MMKIGFKFITIISYFVCWQLQGMLLTDDRIHVHDCRWLCRYLFWSVDNGIYRSELQVDGSVDQSTGRRLVVSGVNIAPFVVDYSNYRLLYPTARHGQVAPSPGGHGLGGVVVSTALDGSDAFVVRNDTASGDLVSVSCFTHHQPADVFYWATSDGQLLTEELDTQSGVFHHNELLIEGTHFADIAVWHPASQPTPRWSHSSFYKKPKSKTPLLVGLSNTWEL